MGELWQVMACGLGGHDLKHGMLKTLKDEMSFLLSNRVAWHMLSGIWQAETLATFA